jgi:2-dehydro-3-deoxygluconokinase
MKKIVTFGEIMLRLKSPGFERLLQRPELEATFGGGEANVAVSLSLLGRRVSYVTALPENAVADAALRELARYGVDVSSVARKKGRLGIYFLESGADQRASAVTYDREGSAIALAKPGDFDWPALLAGADWFHLTGITPALSQGCADLALEAVRAARKAGVRVSIDLNYRKKLWNYGKKPSEVMCPLAAEADLIVANEEDIQKCLGIGALSVDGSSGPLDAAVYGHLLEEVRSSFPSVSRVAVTLRESLSADRNGWSALLLGERGLFASRKYEIDDIVDRVGGGDAFSAALIFALDEFPGDDARALEFAVAASCLKHSIPGDFNLVTRSEVEALMAGDATGRVRR